MSEADERAVVDAVEWLRDTAYSDETDDEPVYGGHARTLLAERDALRARVAELEAELGEWKALAQRRLEYRDELRARIAELEVARPQWTTQAPTVPGSYLVRDRARPAHFQPVEVEPLLSGGRLVAYRCGMDGFVELSHFVDCEWAGPLVAP